MSDANSLLGKSLGWAAILSGIGAVFHGLYQPNRYVKIIAGLVGSSAGLVYYLDRK